MTEVVYRLYETVDELTTVIENARSVPMSASCMVPRDHRLDLLDDLRESLPEDVRAAGAIVEQVEQVVAGHHAGGRHGHAARVLDDRRQLVDGLVQAVDDLRHDCRRARSISRSLTALGTSRETSPPNVAICLTRLEDR